MATEARLTLTILQTQLLRRILEAIKAVKALDVSGDGKINEEKFFRLTNPWVIKAAEARVALAKKVAALWKTMPLNKKQEVERLQCWDIILKDEELATLIGKSEKALGKK